MMWPWKSRERKAREAHERTLRTQCAECSCYGGFHRAECSLITVDNLRAMLKSASQRADHNSHACDYQRREAARWQAKFIQVKLENNKLRRMVSKQRVKEGGNDD